MSGRAFTGTRVGFLGRLLGTPPGLALLGTFGDLPENNLHLAWIQLDQASHPLGPSRDCDSCHGREVQVSRSSWKYVGGQGARPFSGSHVVTADREGLRIGQFEIDGEIELREGARLSDFAASGRPGSTIPKPTSPLQAPTIPPYRGVRSRCMSFVSVRRPVPRSASIAGGTGRRMEYVPCPQV